MDVLSLRMIRLGRQIRARVCVLGRRAGHLPGSAGGAAEDFVMTRVLKPYILAAIMLALAVLAAVSLVQA